MITGSINIGRYRCDAAHPVTLQRCMRNESHSGDHEVWAHESHGKLMWKLYISSFGAACTATIKLPPIGNGEDEVVSCILPHEHNTNAADLEHEGWTTTATNVTWLDRPVASEACEV